MKYKIIGNPLPNIRGRNGRREKKRPYGVTLKIPLFLETCSRTPILSLTVPSYPSKRDLPESSAVMTHRGECGSMPDSAMTG